MSTLGAAWDQAGGTGLAAARLRMGTGLGPHASSGRGGDGTSRVAGDKAVPITWGKDGVKGPRKAPAPHRLVRASHLKHFLDAYQRMEPGAGFLPYEGANPSSPPCSLPSPWDPWVVPGRLRSGLSAPGAFPAIHGTGSRAWAREVDQHSCPLPCLAGASVWTWGARAWVPLPKQKLPSPPAERGGRAGGTVVGGGEPPCLCLAPSVLLQSWSPPPSSRPSSPDWEAA